MRDSANIFKFDFATQQVTQVTQLRNEFTGAFSVSPDGQWIVFEGSKTLDEDRAIDLWIVGMNGRNSRLPDAQWICAVADRRRSHKRDKTTV